MDDLINGRTPEAIKSGIRNMLEVCADPCGVGEACREICCSYDGDECCHETILMGALALIERLESERDAALAKVPKWISVKERVPKDRQVVYMHTNNGRTFKGIYLSHTGFERYKHGDGWTSVKNVTYWTTLPEPPKENAHADT